MRRILAIPLLLSLLSCTPQATLQVPAAPARIAYKGMKLDLSSIQSHPERAAIIESIRAQIDLVDAAITEPQLRQFLFAVPLVTAPDPMGWDDAAYSDLTGQLALLTAFYSPEKPVLLHELLHAYHQQKLPNGYLNPVVMRLYQQARASGRFPADSRMLYSAREYFAMMSSVYLHGTAAREPFTRAAIREKQPDCYAWLEQQFGPRPAP